MHAKAYIGTTSTQSFDMRHERRSTNSGNREHLNEMAAGSLLYNLTIAVTGDFGIQRTPEKQKQWILYHGGRFANDVCEGVTHLVCSEDHFKKRVKAGKSVYTTADIRLTYVKFVV